jgi:hypothetical protein
MEKGDGGQVEGKALTNLKVKSKIFLIIQRHFF